MRAVGYIFAILPKSQRWQCVYILILMMIGALFEAIGIGAIMPLISIMGQDNFLEKHFDMEIFFAQMGITTHLELIFAFSIALILFYIIKNVFIVFEAKQQINFVINNQIFFAHNLLREYIKKPYTFHLDTNPAVLFQYINHGAATAFSYIIMPLLFIITELVTTLTIFLLLFYVDYVTTTFVAIFFVGILFMVLRMFRRKITHQGEVRLDNCLTAIKWLNQSLGGIKEIKVMNRESFFLQQYVDTYTKFGEAEKHFYFLSALPKSIIETFVVCGLLLLIIIKLSMGETISSVIQIVGILSLAAFRLMPGINRIVSLLNSIKYQMPLFNEIYEQLVNIKGRADSLGGKGQQKEQDTRTRLSFNNSIEVEDISFVYPGTEKKILQNINLRIPKGKFVGVVGESGAGKTTFVDVLLGLLEPSTGQILIDKQNLVANMDGWHHILSYVPQSIYLTDASIKENVAFGVDADKVDISQVEKALNMADLSDFVKAQPDGLDTLVGDRGVKLSGGQRQRIGIARALYTNPEVLILDEATSALDNQTEKEIMSTILKLKGKITIIAIAHRLTTLEQCDFKIHFHNGTAEVVGEVD